MASSAIADPAMETRVVEKASLMIGRVVSERLEGWVGWLEFCESRAGYLNRPATDSSQ